MYVLSLSQVGKESVGDVGGKGANMGEMVRAGLPVPPGFVVTTESYMQFIRKNGIEDGIKSALAGVDANSIDSLNNASEKIRNLMLGSRMPELIEREIREAYDQLSFGRKLSSISGVVLDMVKAGRWDAIVAVRSSATSEDMSSASFAGQLESILSVHGKPQLLDAIKKCWASLFTPRVLFYRKMKGSDEFPGMGVIVQRMIQSEKSGVMFTVNPVNNMVNQIVIESAWGYGESIVSGLVTPDEHIIDKATGGVISRRIGSKKWLRRMDPVSGAVIKEGVDSSKVNAEVLNPDELRKLWELGRRVEDYFGGKPQDIEWCIERNRAFLVQTRPVTTLGIRAEAERREVGGEALVRGLGASPGMAKGKVRLAPDAETVREIGHGEILVTVMTNPSMVPLMKKVAAIVTDEGGSTCFTGDTILLTNKGFRTIAEVCSNYEGLEVPSLNKHTMKIEWKPVIASMKRKSNVIEIEVSIKGNMKGNKLKLTPNHKMLTIENRGIVEKEISNMLENKECLLIADRIPQISSSSEKDTKLAYMLGALMTDGYVSHNRRRGYVMLIQKPTEKKLEFIKYMSEILEERSGRKIKELEKKPSYGYIRGKPAIGTASSYSVHSKVFAEQVDIEEQKIITTLLNGDEKLSYSFLAGVIDGDGCFYNNRINIYCDNSLIEPVIAACLRIGILPQVTSNRTIYNVQIVENIDKLLSYTKRVKGPTKERVRGTRFFCAKQVVGDIIDDVNYLGRIKSYVKGNLLLDSRKIKDWIIPIANENNKKEFSRLIDSDMRMLRVRNTDFDAEEDVFNITVQDNHNYIVFTSRCTPVIVGNCHASIISRELGIPCIVGTGNATQILKDGQEIIVDATNGRVFDAAAEVTEVAAETPAMAEFPSMEILEKKLDVTEAPGMVPAGEKELTATSIKANIAFPEAAEKAAPKADGVGLLRAEHMLAQSGRHPVALAGEDPEKLVEIIEEGVGRIARIFYPKPVWYRTLDARTDEFREMEGGESEPSESNPMLGWHGIRRALDEPDVFRCELQALRNLRYKGIDNVSIMLPFVISVDELKAAKAMISFPIKVGIMVETPAAAAEIDAFCEEGIAFASIGSNDLTQLVLGVDRGNARIAKLYNEFHPAVLKTVESVIRSCRKHKVEVSLCGESGSNPKMAELLVEAGIDSISVEIDAIEKIRSTVAKTERKLLLDRVRE